MNQSDHGHHDHHDGMDHGGMDHGGMDHGGMDHGESATKQLMNAAVNLITSTLSPPAMDYGGHNAHSGHHNQADIGADVENHTAHAARGHSMPMSFHTRYDDQVILFDFWIVNTLTGLLLSCLGIFIMAALYEGLKWFRVHLQTVFESRQLANRKSRTAKGAPLLRSAENGRGAAYRGSGDVYAPTTSESDTDVQLTSRQSLFSGLHLVQTLLYILQLVLAYWLMLIVMTYNVYLTAAVILGAGLGHWLFTSFSFLSTRAETFASDACH